MSIAAVLKSIFLEARVADETLWHKRKRAPMFSRTVDGHPIKHTGQIWRRKHNGQWEYREDEETVEQFEGRML